MSDESKRRLPQPPYNPGLRDLVAGKRQGSPPASREDAKAGFRGWHERGYLPHRDEPGLTQFVTFRLADGFPTELRGEWAHLFRIEDDRRRRMELETYLDKGRGGCHLREHAVGAMVESALRFFHGRRYALRAWTVMPNHVHVLFKVDILPMSRIIESWKKFTAHEADKMLQRRGRFWAEDYWDTYMRDADQEARTIRYIECNPVKAHLAREPREWLWTSARHRDSANALTI